MSQFPLRNRVAPPGFTLVEIMVVLVILAIAAAVIIPQVVGTTGLQAQSAARMLMADLEYAQNQAIVTQALVTVTFDVANNCYQLASNESGTLIHPITKQAYIVDFDNKPGVQNVSIAAADFGGSSSVTFDAMGAPGSDGTVTITAGTHTYTASVAPITGRVSVAENP